MSALLTWSFLMGDPFLGGALGFSPVRPLNPLLARCICGCHRYIL